MSSQASTSEKGVVLRCAVAHCKKPPKRFEFCEEHYEHFKFGLVKKNGQPAADYEKKYHQYLTHHRGKGGPSKKVA